MEYWEFLLQKEGDRSWQPIRSKTQIEAGRYRVVVHSSRINTDVEICITHQSTDEIPPKRRAQKRSRRTNPEGLMVVIPYTYLKSGLWELRCCGDIMSDFLGLSWQHSVQLVVLPKVTEVVQPEPISPLLAPAQTEIQAERSDKPFSTAEPEIVEPTPTETEAPEPIPVVAAEVIESDRDLGVEISEEESAPLLASADNSMEATPSTPQEAVERDAIASPYPKEAIAFGTPLEAITSNGHRAEEESEKVEESKTTQLNPNPTPFPLDSPTEVPTLESDEAQMQPAFLADLVMSQELAEFDEDESTFALALAKGQHQGQSPQEVTPTNPILDQSLQMIEQILQQVLDPVMQEFERSESSEPEITTNSELFIESTINQQGLILTLDDESLVARRGQSLIISGQVDVLDVHQLKGGETSRELNIAFQGRLCYELRDPQNSHVLLEVEQPLPEQALPIGFNHSLEIPPECKTRLILGKVTLYEGRGRLSGESNPVALASQPFTVTADLEELLGAIIPGTQAMPVAKVMVLANNLVPLQDSQDDLLELSPPGLKHPMLDLVDVTQSQPPLSLKPSSGNPLPPQIYQPTTNSRPSKSLQLPKLPKVRSITQSVESSAPQASSLIVTVSEPEKVETLKEDAMEQPPRLTPGDSPAVAILEASVVSPTTAEPVPVNTTDEDISPKSEDTEPEPQLQEAMQQLDAAISQIQSAVPLSSAPIASDVSDSPVPLVESPDVTVPPNDDAVGDSMCEGEGTRGGLAPAADREGFDSHSRFDSPETLESFEFTAESPIKESEETDEWESLTFSAASWLNDSDATETQIQSPHVADRLSEVVSDSSTEGSKSSPAPESAVVDNAFQSLNLQDRFWLRLNSLATDTELSQWLRSDSSSASNAAKEEDEKDEEVTQAVQSEPVSINVEEVTQAVQSEPVSINVEEVTQPLTSNTLLTDFDESMWEEESADFDEAIADSDTEPLQPPPQEESTASEEEILDESSLVNIGEIDWAAREFVVDDEDEELLVPEKPEPQPEIAQKVAPAELPTPQPQPQPRPQREMISPRRIELPVPPPELSIPTKELAAGEPVTVRVKLPPHPARLCVKLWVQDRQSRSLLDGPRWLMDLIPDRSGEQEALTQLTVPFGSVEIRFEAIAVDIDSQRESHKVAVDCVVIPPDLPNFSLDDFDT